MKSRPRRPRAPLRPIVLVALVCSVFLLSGGTATAALTSRQESLARTIDGELIAPCCWTQTVAEHKSEAAEQMKAQTRDMIAQGKSEDEILDQYVAQYGERILASPRARGFNLLLFVLPIAAVAVAGTAGTIWLLRRRRTRPPQPDIVAGTSERSGSDADGTAASAALRDRVERELSEFDR